MAKLVSVSYGHGSPSGKLYDYETDKDYRTGDVIVVPVEHHKSHKLYNTLAVVQMTTNEDTAKWKQKADHLTDPDNDIKPKSVGQRLDVANQGRAEQGKKPYSDARYVGIRTLPGYKGRESNEKWSSGSRLISREE